jgi:Protein of unknown function (DUF1616)
VNVRHRDLLACAGAALTCAALALAVPATPVRALAAIPLCLFLPGYALTAASFARARPTASRRVMMTLALSLATLAVGAIVVSASPWGLRSGSWAGFLLVVVGAGCVVAARRRPARPRAPRRRLVLPPARELALLACAIVIAAGAFVFSRVPLPAHDAVGYTALSMLPAGHAMRIEVQSGEQHATTYRLQVQMGRKGRVVTVDPALTLEPGARARFRVPVLPATRGLVAARLYRAGDSRVYRYVTGRVPAR